MTVYNPQVISRQNIPLLITVVLAVLAGILMRTYQLGDHPYGLYQDEAVNGLDALRVLNGEHPIYFEANNGREPVYIYTMAGTVQLFGRTPLGVRAASAIFGVLTLPAVFLLGKIWFNDRVGLLSMAILSGMLWHVHLSRVGFRAVALPLFASLTLALAAFGLKRSSRTALIGSGIMLGLSAYTYLAARFIPFALIMMGFYAYGLHKNWLRQHLTDLVLIFGSALAVCMPLVFLFFTQPDVVLGRTGQVAIWNPAIHQGAALTTFLRSTLAALGMFIWRGDDIWRHNVPYRPVFDPLLAIAFVVGVIMAVKRWKVSPLLAFSLIWLIVLLLPTILAEDSPHFLRAAGVIPAATLIPAVALNDLLERRPSMLTSIGVSAIIVVGTIFTTVDYFGCSISRPGFDYAGCYATDEVRGYFFQAEATDLVSEVNKTEGNIYLDRRYWSTYPSVQFLVEENPSLELYSEGFVLPERNIPLTLYAWPYSFLDAALEGFPPEAVIHVDIGPQTRGDLDPETYHLYVKYSASEEVWDSTSFISRFSNGIVLHDVTTVKGESELMVKLAWSAEDFQTERVQLFVQVQNPSGAIDQQVDEPPGTLYYPPLSWSEGHVIIQSITFEEVQDRNSRLLIGLYDPQTLERIHAENASVAVEQNALVIPLN